MHGGRLEIQMMTWLVGKLAGEHTSGVLDGHVFVACRDILQQSAEFASSRVPGRARRIYCGLPLE